MDISFLIFILSKSPIIDADTSLNVSNGFICNRTYKTNGDITDTISSYKYNTLVHYSH